MPVRWGGLGLRFLADLAPSAYLSSIALVRPLLADILPTIAFDCFIALRSQAIASWHLLGGRIDSWSRSRGCQRAWDDAICIIRVISILSNSLPSDCARLLACVLQYVANGR